MAPSYGYQRRELHFGLKPYLAESVKLSPGPLFTEKVRDIVGLYLNPPVRHEAPADRVG